MRCERLTVLSTGRVLRPCGRSEHGDYDDELDNAPRTYH
jgi:hypothetical protein